MRAWLVAPARYGQAVQRSLRARKETMATPNDGVTQQLSEVRSDIARLQDLVSKGAVREHEIRVAIRSLREKEASLAGKLQKPEDPPIQTFEALPPEVVDKFNATERRDYIRGIIAEIVAHPDGRLDLTPRVTVQLPQK